MLTRDRLTVVQWHAIRNTPHHVVVAVSATGGSPFDDMLERNAGMQAIVDAMHHVHPLVREIAGSAHIMQAQQEIRNWFYTLEEPQRTPRSLQQKALESMHHALEALDTHGSPEDLMHYAAFVLSTATRVARAAREGDLFGIGGELISRGEQEFIRELEALAEARKK
jgi:hypothetical protein